MRRDRPPTHLADLDTGQRRAVVTDLGDPAFRADQLSRHYFVRLNAECSTMTDL
ncbi:MAG: 23S rRNA (adenine(2503)-C(2))-methyltransferase RlmN, partial [Actinomycetota bacterium]|nr:23S rRNA (adenine(2503)-C(2))-methyltransferase RlmN [Actinomycetota bacterium]